MKIQTVIPRILAITIAIFIAIFLHASTVLGLAATPFILSVSHLSQTQEYCSITMERPHLANAKADSLIATWFAHQAASFARESSASLDPDHWPYCLAIAVGAAFEQRNFSSLKFEILKDTGGAHPNLFFETFVFDRRSGTRLMLKDIFTHISPALACISEHAIKQIQNVRGCKLCTRGKSGLFPLVQNFRYVVITQNGLSFFFPPYQAGPYSAGEQQAFVPLNALKQWINPHILKKW